MPSYFLLTESSKEGPFSDVELMDLLDREVVQLDDLCEPETGGEPFEIGSLFEIIHPEAEDEDEEIEEEAEEEATPVAPGKAPEEILYVAHPSIVLFIPHLIFSCLFAALGYFFYAKHSGAALLLVIIAVGILAVAYVLRHRHSYEITTRRVVRYEGLIMPSTVEIRIADIRTINVKRTGLKGMVGIGIVEFSSAGTEDGKVDFENVARCVTIQTMVRKLQG
jgi:membrane protein YdbS with pleckstrin-like domain